MDNVDNIINKEGKVIEGKDFLSLEKEVLKTKGKQLVIYGCGANGEILFGYLHMLGIEVQYFVDRQAEQRKFEVLGKPVISLHCFFSTYKDEIIIISPDNHNEIYDCLVKNGVPHENIILPFSSKIFHIQPPCSNCVNNIMFKTKSENLGKPKATVFSIIYNTPKSMLRRAIESILLQTERKFVYLIIDNGSNDGSNEIINQYAMLDSRITVVTFRENVLWTDEKLLTVLRNNIHGNYVCMLDSDDYYEPTFLEKTIKIAQNNPVEFVQVNTLTYTEDAFKYSYYNQTLGKDICLYSDKLLQYFLLRIVNVTFWGKLYTRNAFDKLVSELLMCNHDERKKYILDISWVSSVVKNAKMVYLCDEILHVRTWRKGSSEFSSSNITRWLDSIVCAVNTFCDVEIDELYLNIFADAALVWLFSLNRKGLMLSHFNKTSIFNSYVQKILKRPICDDITKI